MIHFNVVLVAFASLMVFGALVRMNRHTSHAMRFAATLLAVALLGVALGSARAEWDTWLDTLMYGSLTAYFIADRRSPCVFVSKQWIAGVSIVVSALTTVAVVYQWTTGV